MMFNIVSVHLVTCEIAQCTSMSKLSIFRYIWRPFCFFLVLKLHPSYVARKADMIRYITLEFGIISTITMTIIIFRLFGWWPSWISSILGHFPCSDYLGLFFTNCRPINELISIGKPFPPILLNLCTLMTGLLGSGCVRSFRITGGLCPALFFRVAI